MSVSLGVAFLAGLVSFLSPCVLPLVPSYVTFITGMTLEELTVNGTVAARRRAAVHALLFILGFSTVFVTLGATATAFGVAVQHVLPRLQQAGGILIALFGLYLTGVLKLPALMRERQRSRHTRP